MGRIRRFTAALLVAGVMAVGVGLEAKGKPGPPSNDAICAYLWSIITYEYVTPTIQELALALFSAYGCTAPQ
jgi:hypothetical protein